MTKPVSATPGNKRTFDNRPSRADPAKAHGMNGYTNKGCRCEICRAAWTEWNRLARIRRAKLSPPKHGYTGYTNYSCRCEICSQANREQSNRMYHKHKAKIKAKRLAKSVMSP